MQRNFLFLNIFVISFIGCEIKGLKNGLYDTNTLLVFLSLSFLIISIVNNYANHLEKYFPGKAETCLFLFLAWSAGTFFYSINPDLTYFWAIKCLGAIAFGLGLFLYLKNSKQVHQIWLLSYFFACIHAASGIVQRFFTYFLYGQQRFVVPSESLFASSNYYACFLMMHIPIGLYFYFNSSSSIGKTTISLGWVFILIALGLSDSIAGQLIAGLQISALILYFSLVKKPERARFVGLATLIAFLIYFSLNQFISVQYPLTRIAQNGINESWFFSHVGLRLIFWLGAWEIFKDYWLLGGGLWAYADLYPLTGIMDIYPQAHSSSNAHNLYLQITSETGLVGLGLFVSSLIFLFKNYFSNFIKEGRKPETLNFYLLVSISGFLIHNIPECNLLPSLFVYYLVFLVVSMGFLNRGNSIEINKNPAVSGKTFLLPTLSFVSLLIGFALFNYYQYNQIILRQLPFIRTLSESEHKLEQAKSKCKRCSLPYYLSGFAKMAAYKTSGNIELINEAAEEYAEAIKRNPYSSRMYIIQGDTLKLQGKKEDATESYRVAIKDPRYRAVALNRLADLDD